MDTTIVEVKALFIGLRNGVRYTTSMFMGMMQKRGPSVLLFAKTIRTQREGGTRIRSESEYSQGYRMTEAYRFDPFLDRVRTYNQRY